MDRAMGDDSDYGFETRAIHAGQNPDPSTGAVITPIFQTSTYAQAGVGDHQGYEYSRTGNPTRTALEECVASLEQGRFGRAFSSGMAAEDAILRTLTVPGDHVVIPGDAYGGTYRLVAQVHGPAGLEFTPADLTSIEALQTAWRPRTKVLWIESPTNPLLTVVDIEAMAAFAHERGARCIVDNTFASPYLQQLGAVHDRPGDPRSPCTHRHDLRSSCGGNRNPPQPGAASMRCESTGRQTGGQQIALP